MANPAQPTRDRRDPLLRAIVALAVALALALLALFLFGNAGRRLNLILGVVQAASAAAAVEAIAVAFVALIRFRVLPQPMPFWIGLAASVSAVGGLVFFLSFPSLFPLGPGTIAQRLSTSAWVSYITNVELVILLLFAAAAPWPRAGMLVARWWLPFVVATVIAAAAIQTAVVVFEGALPVVITARGIDPWLDYLYVPLVILTGIGAGLFAHRYRHSGDILAGYASLAEVLLAAQYVALMISRVRIDVAYYVGLALLFGAPTVLLYGLLSDYAGLYRREKELSEEARRRAEELAALQQVTDQLLDAEHRARERAEEAVRARELFLETAAHELKTPITNLRGYAQTTMRRLERAQAPDLERLRQALGAIDRQSDRLARLVQQLLDVATIEAGQLHLNRQETDLVPLVRRVVESVQAGTERHTLSLDTPPSLLATVDSERIANVLANLLDNAAKFSPEGTPIEIELSAPTPGMAQLSVRDYGPGVPVELRPRLFGRFFQAQAERPFAGVGLGLYYSRRIVELHGGEIRAEFPAEGGSRFVVALSIAVPVKSGEEGPGRAHAGAGG